MAAILSAFIWFWRSRLFSSIDGTFCSIREWRLISISRSSSWSLRMLCTLRPPYLPLWTTRIWDRVNITRTMSRSKRSTGGISRLLNILHRTHPYRTRCTTCSCRFIRRCVSLPKIPSWLTFPKYLKWHKKYIYVNMQFQSEQLWNIFFKRSICTVHLFLYFFLYYTCQTFLTQWNSHFQEMEHMIKVSTEKWRSRFKFSEQRTLKGGSTLYFQHEKNVFKSFLHSNHNCATLPICFYAKENMRSNRSVRLFFFSRQRSTPMLV